MYNSLGDFMKQIFKYALKLFGNLVFAWFASITLVISFSVIFAKASKWVFYLFLQSFSFILLIVLVWNTLYNIGFKDSNMVRIGRQREDLYRGFKIGALAQMPALAFLIVSIIFNFKFAIYRLLNSSYYWFLTAIAGKDEYMRMGSVKIIGIALLLLIVPAISGTVYILGYKGIDLFSKLVYKKSKEK